MGQLERYGLYVLCLVIFLILGVAIWGGDPQVPPKTPQQTKLVSDHGTEPKLKTPEDYRREVAEYIRRKEQSAALEQAEAQRTLFRRAERPDQQQAEPKNMPAPGPVHEKPAPAPDKRPDDTGGSKPLREHRIAKDDNLMALAHTYLGDRNQWRKILAVNPGLRERSLPTGRTIKIPHRELAKKAATKRGDAPAEGKLVAGGTHKVQPGENPWLIAERVVGRSSAAGYTARLLKLNNIRDASAVVEGTVLKLPPR
ncbi:MAG: LysM peptidoglycan-binding domain-containing protein [Planctomycetes bacterium]|nr:LysM peptidoglycan-binding domain-containing protein [Planctomycetota bacterium]MCB9871022.1 LysM peptidoglycan-binding domain-containing protein [Planctomycetota bacterium]